jgi:hypothetical protein
MRSIAVITLSATLAMGLTSCAAGNDAPTAMTKQVTDGVEGAITTQGNDLSVSGLLLVAQPDGSAVLVATMINRNTQSDDLLAVGANDVVATLSATTIPMLENQPLRFSGDTSNAKAVFPNLNIAPGNRVKVKLFFSHAGEMTLDAIVREQTGVYAGVTA